MLLVYVTQWVTAGAVCVLVINAGAACDMENNAAYDANFKYELSFISIYKECIVVGFLKSEWIKP